MTLFYETELSHGQRSLWFLHRLAPEAGAYNIAAAARVRSPVDVERLERTFQSLVDRHGALRTTFPAVAGEPCRRVAGHLTFTLAREDATGWCDERLRARLAEEAWRPFDLETGPLLRVTLFTGDPRGPVLLVVIHHIVADFWSLAILMREVPALYGEAELPPPGLSYDEHVRLEREAASDALLEWWRKRLAGLPNLELATDRPRPAVQTYRGDTHRLRLSGELAAALRARSRAQHGTLFMTLTAAFQALLGRHTGQEDLAIGTARSGRSGGAHAQLAGTVGYFVNQVVLRGDLAGDPAFAELLERTKAMVRDAFAQGDYPLPLLAERLQPERDASRTPLFQVSFVLQKETRGAEGLTAFALGEEGVEVGPPDFRLESLAVPRQPAPFDLVLHAVERQGGLSLALQYNTDLFDATTTARLLEHFERLLAGVAVDPTQRLSELPLLSEAERAQLLVEWNDTGGDVPETTLSAAFHRQSALHPNLPAVVFEGSVLTYAEVAERAGRLASRLRALGVGPDVPVALYFERSAAVIVAILGILEAGGAYLPLDPNHPPERLATMLVDAGRPLLVTERRMAGPLTAAAGEVLWLDEEEAPELEPASEALPESLAYILHTSGSTGKPKGVCCHHRGALNLLADFARRQPLAPGSRGSLWTSLGFDVSVYEIFAPLLAGGAVHVAPEAIRQDTESFLDWLEEERIESAYVPPFMVAALHDRLERTGEPSSLRRLLVGVEPIPEPLLARIAQRVPGLVVINGYGPTEATICATLYDVDPRRERFGPTPITPIGRPAADMEVYLLGPCRELVPLGVPGELCIAGVGLARGYWRRPDATAERFVPHPWSAGERLYRTGDLARRRPDGNLEFVGRIDHQIKLRGFRIEPGEIEAALRAHPQVREAVVTVWPPAGREAQGRENRRLVGYVVLHRTDRTDPTDRSDLKAVLAWLRGRLPAYMVPASLLELPELPLTPSGKLDRKALPAPGAEAAGAWVPPRTPAEVLVAGIFAEVLGIDRVGAEDSFFERGGHSLAALKVLARVREAFGVELPLHRVFETPAVAGLAAAIESAAASGATPLPPLLPVPRGVRREGEPLPLSFPQQRLWFLHELEPESAAYNVPAAVHLRGRLDPAVLAASLDALVRRHETLRTRFAAEEGRPVQIVDPPAPVPVPEVDLRGLPAERRKDEARRRAAGEALRPFDLERGPLLRTVLVRLADEEHLLLLTLHHVVSDGWSLRVLARELGEVYGAFAQGVSPSLPKLDIQYGDYALWQRSWLQGEVLEEKLAWWRNRLAGAPEGLDLPFDRPRTASTGDRGASRPVVLPPDVLPALRALARQRGVTLFMAVLAAWQALLARISGSFDVSVGTPVAGREQIQVQGLIGFFVNTLVLRTDLSGAPSFAELLARVREVALGAYAHQDLPFERLVEELRPHRGHGEAPLFQTAFSLEEEPVPLPRLGGVEAALWPLEAGAEKFDLSLILQVEGEELRGTLGFRTALFDGTTIERLAGDFVRLLAEAVADPDRPLPDLPLVAASGRRERAAPPVSQWTAPRTPVEEILAAIWTDVLGVPAGREDNFFDLGGHSLLATQMLARVRKAFRVELPLRTLFDQPALADLAASIEEAQGRERREAPPIEKAPRDEPPALSFAQQRLWFLDLLEPGSPLYNIAAVVELTGRLKEPALEAALAEVVRRHEALRVTFQDAGGMPAVDLPPRPPLPSPPLPPGEGETGLGALEGGGSPSPGGWGGDGRGGQGGRSLPLIDLQSLPERQRAPESRRLSLAEARRPFDLREGPLLRLALLKLAPERHQLLLTVHHIVSDGWSMGVLVRELGALYAAFRAGQPSPLPELPIQYADYAAWQRRRLSGDLLQAELAWWREQLAGMPQVLELPADHPHPARRSVRGAEHSFTIPSGELARLSRAHGATLFMTLLAVFAALLRRYAGEAGQDDLGVGTPVAGRTRVETEPLIGLFVNTLVLRVDLAGDPDLATLLGRVRDTALAAYAHQELPFERLVEELAGERDLSRSPLVQVLFALQNAPMGPLELRDLALAASPVPTGTARLELSCTLTENLAETERGLAGTIEYSRDLFEAPTIARLAGHYTRLLAEAVAFPRRPVSELPLLSDAESQQAVVEWNDTASAYPRDATLPELFAAVAAERPDAPAIIDGGEVWSYRKLDEASSRLARHLQRQGVGSGEPVGLSLERSAELIVGMLAILKAGGAYVPLDPGYPEERLAFMRADVGARVVVGAPHPLAPSPTPSRPPGEGETGCGWERGPGGEGLAYLIYTSGSTGRPKGVAVPHRGVVRLVRGTNYLQITPEDRVAFLASTSFDAATFEIWGALLNGAALVVIPEEAVLSPVELGALLRREGVTVLHLTTALFHQVAREAPEMLAPLRAVLFGGEAADPGVVVRLLEQGVVERLLHFYGPTESTTFSTWAGLSRSTGLTIGRPVANTAARVLDRHGAPVPPLVAGELHVGGDGLAWGYWNRPELTAERFVPSPWGYGERLYRTGDLVRHRADGRIEFLGRLDDQVKVRGFRVEPEEIESVLRQYPGTREAAVVVRENRLVAYVVLDRTDPTDRSDPSDLPHRSALRAWLEERLPAYMVPSFFSVLPALPLTPSGKVDRKALAHLRPERASEMTVAPRTPTEELLAGIFAGVLKLEQVGVTDSFFELGGHSLLAAQVVARIRTVLGVELPVRTVFEAPTVEGLAAAVAGGSWLRSAPPTRVERPGPLPLSFAQERLWFLQQLEPGSATYNMPVAVELSGALDRFAFTEALVEIVRRQESLRTRFAVIDGVPRQWIAPPSDVPLPFVDLSALPDAIAEAERLAREHAALGFDLEQGPLARWLLVGLGAERHRFLLSLHHVISDGWSLGVLVRELGALYGTSRPLPELPIQVADFAVWQRERLAETQAAQLAYWESRLGGEIAPAELPTDRPRPAVQTFRGGRRRLGLSPELTARLHGFGRGEGATLFMTLLAATQALIARHSGETDVPVGAPIAGRPWEEIEGVIGCFLNTLVLRTDLSGAPSFRELVARVRTVTLEAYAHQDVPFEAVLARLRLDRDLSRSPLFQVLFNLLSLPAPDLALPGLDLRVLTPAEVPSKLDVTFYVSEAEGSLRIDLVYNADLFDEARMADLLAQLELLLAQAIERPDEPVDHHSLVTGRSRALLPDPAAPLDAGWIGGVHELFAAQAERSPARPAVVDGGVVWSYGDLLAGSRGVAGWLVAQGVRPGDPVAIFAHRSAPLVQAVQGVLLAGAAFVILDPAYPAPRLAEMLGLAAPRAWISLEAAGSPPEAIETWLEEAGCPRLELPAGGRTSLEHVADFSGDAPRVPAGPHDLACIGFTSGSTGGPKGILGLHGSLSHFLPAYCAELGLGPDDRFSLLSGLSHDPLQRDVFTALYLGAAIIVPDPADFGIAGRLADWMSRERVTASHLTPALSQLLTALPPGGAPAVVPSLRRAILIGEALTRQDVARLHALTPGVTCFNLYGATETQRALSFHRVTRDETRAAAERARQVLPLGRGFRDAQLLVLNRAGGLAGVGEVGEIVVRSPHLARGYLGDPEATAARFQVNPFTGAAEDRIYRTGDLGRYLPDGEVAFAGRADLQVKLRGFRIELAEIEAALTRYPPVGAAVREAVVLLRDDLPGGSGLVAYVVPGASGAADPAQLHDHLWQQLPAYMVPAAFLFLESLPRTPSGKIDRRSLSRLDLALPSSDEGTRAPRTPVEEIVAGLWAEVLGRDRIGPDDNFFQLGGHSLTGAQIVSRLREVFQVELPLRVLFEAPTLAGLASEVERRRRPDGAPERPAIAAFRQDRSAPPPLSFAQERLWAERETEARSVAFTIPTLVVLAGELDLPCLWRALQEVVDRHEVLRTTFRDEAGHSIQVVQPPRPFPFPVIGLEGLSRSAQKEEIQHWSTFEGRRHFDLENGPLFRLTLFRCTARESALLFVVHHIAFDGWSRSVLTRELAAIYNAFRAGRPSPLRPLATQYQDFARWQRQVLQGEALEREVSFWREHLRGASPVRLGRPLPTRPTFEAGIEVFLIPEELERKLEAFAAAHCATLFMTLLAAFEAVLHEESGRDDIVVTCLFANRNQLEIEGLIGNFFAGLPLRTRLAGARTFRDLLERVRDVTLAAIEHPDILYDPVMEGLGLLAPGERGGLATFRILFQLAQLPRSEQTLADLELIHQPFDTGKIRQDLSLFLTQGDRLGGRFKYNRDVLDRETVVRLRDRFLQTLAEIVGDPERPLEILELAERAGTL